MIAPLLLPFRFARFGPGFSSADYLVLSAGTLALVSGWRYVLGFVGLRLGHEMGHHTAARRLGIIGGSPAFHSS
jgi:hypothetical protein